MSLGALYVGPAKDHGPWWSYVLGYFVTGVAVAVCLLWQAFALQCTWRWLVVPSGLPDWPLRTWLGLSLVVTALTAHVDAGDEGKSYGGRLLAHVVLGPLMMLGLAYVFSRVL